MRFFLYIVIACYFISCRNDKVYFSRGEAIPSHEWNRDYPVEIEFEVSDTVGLYDFYLDIRHGEQYAYSNLFLFTELTFPNGKQTVDTLECPMADEKGQWLGSGGGSIFEAGFKFKDRRKFPISGKYKLEIRHGMREIDLPGIYDAGLRIEKSL